MGKPSEWRPEIPDKASRGALCSRIQQLVKAMQRVRPGGAAPDAHELKCLLKRLDEERAKFHKLYSYKAPSNG